MLKKIAAVALVAAFGAAHAADAANVKPAVVPAEKAPVTAPAAEKAAPVMKSTHKVKVEAAKPAAPAVQAPATK